VRSPVAIAHRDLTIGGASVRYLCGGSGPHLLLIASPLLGARTYLAAMRKLCRSYTVVCVELPGSGASERLAAPWSTERYAAWTLDFMRHLPLAAPVVIGDGAAAPIASQVARLARLANEVVSERALVDEVRSSMLFGLHAACDMLSNAVRHRGVFAAHVRNARSKPARVHGQRNPVFCLSGAHLTTS
jgi:pimeloyl-ACP methyl ester carboxylesterase